jgi:hypothetical protein
MIVPFLMYKHLYREAVSENKKLRGMLEDVNVNPLNYASKCLDYGGE